MPAVGAAGSLWYTRVPRHRSRQLHAHHSPGHRGPACDRRAISVPLTPAGSGTSRLLADSRLPSSSWATRTIPAICKQGVRGSSPLSSTDQKQNSKSRAHTSEQVQQQSTATGTAGDAAHSFELGAALARAAHRSRVAGSSSGSLSRKNALGGPGAACLAVSGQCAESAVSRPAPAAEAEGQRMASYFRHPSRGREQCVQHTKR